MTRRPLKADEAEDLLVGDWVHAPLGIGWIEDINGDHATAAYHAAQRDILPLISLRRCTHGGGGFDRRRGG